MRTLVFMTNNRTWEGTLIDDLLKIVDDIKLEVRKGTSTNVPLHEQSTAVQSIPVAEKR